MADLKKKPAGKKRRRGISVPHGLGLSTSRVANVKLADGALTRIFGKDNESAAEGGWTSQEELILEDARLRPDLYPEFAKPTKRRPVNPSGKSGYYKR